MAYRIPPVFWPALAAAAPVLVPVLALETGKFYRGRRTAAALNAQRIALASALELPELEALELTVVVDHAAEEGYLGDAGVSYLLRSERGSVLLDVGFGPERPAAGHNLRRLRVDGTTLDAMVISHLHLDHIGGLKAARERRVALPEGWPVRHGLRCYVPSPCETPGMTAMLAAGPMLLPGGFGTTGPLARMLCFGGITEEQAILARVKGKGLVVVTGCGHQTVETLFAMLRRLSPEPIHTFAGGLHLPLTASRLVRGGIQLQQIIGTGKIWWERITLDDLESTVATLNAAGVERLLLSGHDSCDVALAHLQEKAAATSEVLRAGARYVI